MTLLKGGRVADLGNLFRPHVGDPVMPPSLSPAARKAWRQIVAELRPYPVLARIDSYQLAITCRALARLELLERAWDARVRLDADKPEADQADAFFDRTPNGMRIQGAHYQSICRERDAATRLLACFGLSPDARARVSLAVRLQGNLFPVNPGGVPTSDAPDADDDLSGVPAPAGAGVPNDFGGF